MRKLDLSVDQGCRSLGHSNRERQRGCGGNHDMRTSAKGTSGMRYICGRMHVRNLDRRAEKQQQSATKSNGDPPRRSRVIFGLLKEHYLQLYVEWLGDGLGDRFFPASLGLEDKFYDFSCRALAASGLGDVVADCF